jgi:multiple sugar transport system substrate-binding protein
MAGGAAAACTPRQSGEIVLRFWAMGNEGGTVGELMPEFERRNPGVRVSVQPLPWTAAHEKLLTAFAGDATPDIAQLGNSWIPELAALRALEPLQPLIAAEGSIVAADYFAGIWNTNVVE